MGDVASLAVPRLGAAMANSPMTARVRGNDRWSV